MGRVPITILGYKCEICGYEWIPKEKKEPKICPKCRSPRWDIPVKENNGNNTYDDFKDKVKNILKNSDRALTWTEIRTLSGLPQMFPNNKWVKRLEDDIGLLRTRDSRNIILWKLR